MTEILALTHAVTPDLARCELTYLERRSIDVERATRQHEAYCGLLRECGAVVRVLSVSPALPDAVFLEDAALVLDELAVSTSMGTASRCAEVANLRPVLEEYRRVAGISPPATLEGGDVLRIGRTLFAGLTSRTDQAGIDALQGIVEPAGYRVVPVQVRDCLHLKTACTALDDGVLLANPDWVDLAPFVGMDVVEVPTDEPQGANTLRLGRTVLMSASSPRTAETLRGLGYQVRTVDISELEKAEAGVTCLCLLVGRDGSAR